MYFMKLKSGRENWNYACATLLTIGVSLVLATFAHAQDSSLTSPPSTTASPGKPAPSFSDTLSEAYQHFAKGELDAALTAVNAAIKQNSQNLQAFILRGAIYAQQKQWDKADYDYDVALVIDPGSAIVKFDRAELKFMQKQYDQARVGFSDLQSDKDLGDFATYKVLLCDLFGAHEDVAAKDLAALNQVGANPSYYFGNAAWDLVHNKTDEAESWLKSASRIYADAPQKIASYTSSLTSLGYLPIRQTTSLE